MRVLTLTALLFSAIVAKVNAAASSSVAVESSGSAVGSLAVAPPSDDVIASGLFSVNYVTSTGTRIPVNRVEPRLSVNSDSVPTTYFVTVDTSINDKIAVTANFNQYVAQAQYRTPGASRYTCDICGNGCDVGHGPGFGSTPSEGFACSSLERTYTLSNLQLSSSVDTPIYNTLSIRTFDINGNVYSFSFSIVAVKAAATIQLDAVGGKKASSSMKLKSTCNLQTVFQITAISANQFSFVNPLGGSLSNPQIKMAIGDVYTIYNLVSTTDPLYIKTALGSGTTGAYVGPDVANNGANSVLFQPDATLLPMTYYYQDSSNAANYGTIVFVDPVSCNVGGGTTAVPSTGVPTTMIPSTAGPTTFAPSTSPVPPSTDYIGCYTDATATGPGGTTQYVLATNLNANALTMTIESCKALAIAANLKYFGVEYGGQCYGSNTLNLFSTTSICNMACAGNAAEVCGNFQAISLYQLVKGPVIITTPQSNIVTLTVNAGGYSILVPYTYTGLKLPVYAPFTATGTGSTVKALLYYNCPDAFCTNIPFKQTVWLCVDSQSCTTVSNGGGYFTIPVAAGGPTAPVSYAMLVLTGSNGWMSQIPFDIHFQALPTTAVPSTAVPSTASTSVPTTMPPSTQVPSTASTSAPTTLVPSTQFMGPFCYTDAASHILPYQLYNGADNTNVRCGQAAFLSGFPYYGTEYGGQCYAGPAPSNPTTSTACNMPCNGDGTATCGGFFALSTYVTPSLVFSGPYCFLDTGASAPVLPNLIYAGNAANTVATCMIAAQKAGYTFFGVENGANCYGGNTMPTTATGTCNVACTGLANQFCGGATSIAVYYATPSNVPLPSTAVPTTPVPSTAVPTTPTTSPPTTIVPSTASACVKANSPNLYFSLSAGQWTISGYAGTNPALTLVAGVLYNFINVAVTSGGDALYIKTAAGTGTTNQYVNSQSIAGQGSTQVMFQPLTALATAGTTLYYTSSVTSTAFGTINVIPATNCGLPAAP